MGHSGVLGKICFRMTQAGSLPATPWGDGVAFSVEEIFSSLWVGISCWLAPTPSLLAGLPQTTLNKPPFTSCSPQLNLCHTSPTQMFNEQLNGGGGPASSSLCILKWRLCPSASLFWFHYSEFLIFCPCNIFRMWRLCWFFTSMVGVYILPWNGIFTENSFELLDWINRDLVGAKNCNWNMVLWKPIIMIPYIVRTGWHRDVNTGVLGHLLQGWCNSVQSVNQKIRVCVSLQTTAMLGMFSKQGTVLLWASDFVVTDEARRWKAEVHQSDSSSGHVRFIGCEITTGRAVYWLFFWMCSTESWFLEAFWGLSGGGGFGVGAGWLLVVSFWSLQLCFYLFHVHNWDCLSDSVDK